MEIIIKDKTYQIQRPTRQALESLVRLAASKLPDPLDSIKAKLAGFSPDLQALMVREAMREARTPKTLASPEVVAWLQTPEGAEQQLRLIFGDDIASDQLWDLHLAAVAEHGATYVERLLT